MCTLLWDLQWRSDSGINERIMYTYLEVIEDTRSSSLSCVSNILQDFNTRDICFCT